MMKRGFAGLLAVIAWSSALATMPARAGGNDVAAGLLGGLAIGAIVGSAVAAPRPVYTPAPVYVAPPPAECYWTYAQPVWDGYRWVRRPVQVCD